jgi:hypothetical protein
MAQITAEQLLQVVASLITNTDLKQIDFEFLGLQNAVMRNGVEAGRQFTGFLKNRCRLIVGEPKIIPIDRSTPFNPETFLGKGWTIWRGPADGNGLEGEEEQDARSLAITELDLSKIQLVTTLREGETVVKGEENLKRLREANYICLDAGIFQTFWNQQELIPQLLKELTNGGITYVFFKGTTLRSSCGLRYALCLYFDEGRWYWDCSWLVRVWDVFNPSVVLASQS